MSNDKVLSWEERRDIERATEHAKIAEYNAKFAAVAAILGFTPDTKERDYMSACAEITAPDSICPGLSLYMRTSQYMKWRIEISGSYPRHADRGYVGEVYCTMEEREALKVKGITTGYVVVPRPYITISGDKTAEAIARDITRRLLPDAIDYCKRVNAIIAQRNSFETESNAALLAVKGEDLTEHEAKSHEFTLYTGKDFTGARVEVKASRSSVDIGLHGITADQARRIVDMLKAEIAIAADADEYDNGPGA